MASIFRAEHQVHGHTAAVKILLYAISRWSDDGLRAEFARNQRELAHEERLLAGQTSTFRRIALQLAMESAADDIAVGSGLAAAGNAASPMRKAATAYVRGRPDAAMLQLTMDDPEALYAGACLSLEMGRPAAALAHLQRVASYGEASSIHRLAERLQEEIAQ